MVHPEWWFDEPIEAECCDKCGDPLVTDDEVELGLCPACLESEKS